MEESDFVKVWLLYSNYIHPWVCKVIELSSETPASGECVTAGWGTKSVTGLLMTAVLQKAPASLVEKQDCKDVRYPDDLSKIMLLFADVCSLHKLS